MVHKFTKQNRTLQKSSRIDATNPYGRTSTQSKSPSGYVDRVVNEYTGDKRVDSFGYEDKDVSYRTIAQEKGIGSVNKNKFVLMDGLEIVRDDGSKYMNVKPGYSIPSEYFKGDKLAIDVQSGENVTNRQEIVGQYSINNGVLAFVDDSGDLYAAPFNPSLQKDLEKAGYKSTNTHFPVPLSNTGKIADSDIRKRWLQDMQRSKRISSGLERAAAVASVSASLGSILFISSNITGNVIGGLTLSVTNIIGVGLFLIAILAAGFYLMKKNK